MMRSRSLGIAFALSLLIAAASAAQEHPNIAKGMGGSGGFGTADIDNVNPFNGNLVIRLPIGQSYPVNAGWSYQFTLTYNSQVWEHEVYDEETRVIPVRGSNAGLGWSLQLGRLNPPQLDQSSSPSPDYSRNTYLAPDGSSHTFYPTLHEGESATPGVEYTRDGSYLRLKTATRQIEFPSGAIHTFSALTNGYLTRMEDRFGNFVQVDYLDCGASCVAVAPSAAHSWRITDTQGRTHWIHLRDTGQPDQARVITQVDLQAFGGARAVYKLLYNDSTDDQSTTGSPVGLTGCRGVDNYSIWFLTKLVLPDGSTYEMPKAGYFSYNVPGDFTNPCKTGLISRLRLPTRGLVEWDYTLYQFPSTSSRWLVRQKATGVGRRSILNAASASIGDWTYGTSLSGGTTGRETLLTNSVTDPLGNRVTRYFSVCVNNCAHPDGPYEYGLPVGRDAGGDGTGRILSAQVLQGGATPLRTTYARFEHDPAGPSTLVEDRSRLNQRLASQRTVFNDDSAGTYADEDFSNFDGLGHYRTRVTGGNFPGNNARIGFVNFNPTVGTYGQAGYAPWPAGSPWVLNTYSFAYDQENDKIQYRISCFESGTGFLLRHRVLKNSGSAESANDLLQVFQRNASGNLVTESHYGGDTQSLSFNACGMALPASPTYQYTHLYTGGVRSRTSVTLGTVLRTLDLTIDTSTGLPNASRDTAGKQTNFSYDTLGRLTLIDPTDDVATTYDYCTATSTPFICPSGVRAQIVITRNNGIDVTAVRQRFDDWGRMINEAERMPPAGNYIDRSINYNALGWQTYVSERSSGSGTSFLSYDAFGRPLTVRPPDGGTHDVFISYQGVRQVSRTAKVATSTTAETSATTTEVYDRFGRLYEVTEPNGTRTRYEYDVGNRLSKVCQNATGTGTATCGQQRLFTYDHRGFLLSERHPEKGASGNGTVSYFNYDARGHATRKVDGPNDLTFSYDKAERLTQVRETGGGFTGCSMTTVAAGVPRCLKEFFYSGGNAGTSYSKGKLVEARRYNYPTIGTSSFTVVVSDLYTYAGREGRASQKETRLTFQGTTNEYFRQSYVYNDFGNVSSLTYPDCAFAACASSPRTLSFGYTNGRLGSISGVINSITYHPSGMVNTIVRANGVTDIWAADPNGMARPARISATTINWSPSPFGLWTTGTLQYDGSGNVKTMGNASYVYDSLSRVTSATVYPGPYSNGTAHTQGHTYDIYGNITSVTTNGAVLTTGTSNATNRLTGMVTYDSAGNLTSWNGALYEYDAFNQMKRFKSGSEEWLYMYTADDERFWEFKVGANPRFDRFTLRGLDGKPLRVYANSGYTFGNFEDNVYRNGMIVATLASSGAVQHLHPDHLGTPRLVSDATGRADSVQFHSYYPFGQELAGTYNASYTNRMRFTGHERDLANPAGDGDDLDYMHARHYNPLTGRFLSTDRAGGHPSAPQSWNRYTYVRNSPPNLVDPDGYEPIPPELLPFYNSYFGHDFSNVSIHSGRLGAIVGFFGNWGMTIGNHVILSPKAMRQVRSSSRYGVAGLGHELVHVLQYQTSGIPAFVNFYIADTAININRGMFLFGTKALHNSLLAERMANTIERRIAVTLTQWVKETVTTCEGVHEECTDGTTTIRWHKETTSWISPSGYGLGHDTSIYDLFLSGAVCLESICVSPM